MDKMKGLLMTVVLTMLISAGVLIIAYEVSALLALGVACLMTALLIIASVTIEE